MGKISDLTPVPVGEIDGTETVVMVKAGATRRANLGDVVAATTGPAVEAAQEAAEEASALLTNPAFIAVSAVTEEIDDLAPQAANIAALAPYAANLPGLADTQVTIPQIGRDNQHRVETDAALRPLRSMTRDQRIVEANMRATPGIDTPGQRLGYVAGNSLNVIGAPSPISIPVAGADAVTALAPQFCGIDSGRQVMTINRPFERAQQAVMLGPDGALAPLPDPDLCYIFLADGQSLSIGTNGRWHSTTQFRSTPELPPNVWMLATPRGSDVRLGRYSDWGTNLNTVVAAGDIIGLTQAGPRSVPVNADPSSAPFNETPLERFAKMFSDAVTNATGRRPMVCIVALGVGAVSIDNMQKVGAANIPNTATTKYAQDILILTALRDRLTALGKRGVVAGALRKHGETSAADAAYATKATQHINDLNADIRTIFGQAGNPIWIEHVHASYGSGNNFNSALGILAMHDAGTLHIAGADYAFLGNQGYQITGVPTPPVPDFVHLTARGYALCGEAMFHQFWSVFAFNRRIRIVRPLSAVAAGNLIDITFDCPSGAIIADGAPGWTDPGNFGITYSDSGGSPPAITGAAVVAPATVRLTMNGSVAGRPNRLVDYANNYSGSSGFSPATKPRGMIRDAASLGNSEVDGNPRRAWGIPSRTPVTGA